MVAIYSLSGSRLRPPDFINTLSQHRIHHLQGMSDKCTIKCMRSKKACVLQLMAFSRGLQLVCSPLPSAPSPNCEVHQAINIMQFLKLVPSRPPDGAQPRFMEHTYNLALSGIILVVSFDLSIFRFHSGQRWQNTYI